MRQSLPALPSLVKPHIDEFGQRGAIPGVSPAPPNSRSERLISRNATGGLAARNLAQAMARPRTCSAGASSLTRPSACARTTLAVPPNKSTSRARAIPTASTNMRRIAGENAAQIDFVQRKTEVAHGHDTEIAGNRQDHTTSKVCPLSTTTTGLGKRYRLSSMN